MRKHPLIFLYGINMEWHYEKGKCFRKQSKSTITEIKIYPLGPLPWLQSEVRMAKSSSKLPTSKTETTHF